MALSLVPPTVPEDYCDLSQQEQVNVLIAGTQVVGTADPAIVFSITEPGVNDRDKAWGLLRGDGSFSGFIFVYSGGAWLAEHEYDPSGDAIMLWKGTLVGLQSFDGGAPGAVTLTTGPMWEEDTDMQGRSAMGPGTIPSDITPARTIAVGDAIGEGGHLQGVDEVGPHTHPLNADADITNANGSIKFVLPGVTGPGIQKGLTGNAVTDLSVLANTYSTVQLKGSVLHPVRGRYFIKRTARKFRTPVDS